METRSGTPVRAIAALFFIFSPFLTHFLLTRRGAGIGPAGAALIVSQGVLIALMTWSRTRPPLRLPATATVLAGVFLLALFHLRGGLVLSAGAPHAAIYLGLLSIFAFSLFPRREPVVTYFARGIHGAISPQIALYTRRVTWVWCAFFALQLIGSALLLVFAPLSWWSTFVNLFNLPMVAALMLGEKLTRPLWVADPPREHFRDFLRMPMLLKRSIERPGIQSL